MNVTHNALCFFVIVLNTTPHNTLVEQTGGQDAYKMAAMLTGVTKLNSASTSFL